MLEIKNLTASIEGKEILKDISFLFETGKIYALLGPNGSGKSTLWSAILGKSGTEVTNSSKIFWNEENITSLPAEKRAEIGLFGTFQSPPPLPGVSIFQLARAAFPKGDALKLKTRIAELARELAISDELLKRGLHDGFSGGEKKKFEALSFALFSPKLVLFDEIETGVDVDSLKLIARFIATHRSSDQTLIFITHSITLLDTLPVDTTLVMQDGHITEIGNGSRAKEILKEEGFSKQ